MLLTTRPACSSTILRAVRSCWSSTARHAVSPRAADRCVEPTMSVKSTVANRRVVIGAGSIPVKNSTQMSVTSRQFGWIHWKWLSPVIST